MSLTTEEQTVLVEAFTERLAAIETCPHEAFPEVTDNPALRAVMESAAEDILMVGAAVANGLAPVDHFIRVMEHALIVTSAFALSMGGVEAVSDSTAPSEADWEKFFSENTDSLPGIDETDNDGSESAESV